jgi:hypothetical protein
MTVDARVNPNPASPGITSIVRTPGPIIAGTRWATASAAAGRLGGLQRPRQVVTKDADECCPRSAATPPNFSVNAHEYPGARNPGVGARQQRCAARRRGQVLPGGTAAPAGQQPRGGGRSGGRPVPARQHHPACRRRGVTVAPIPLAPRRHDRHPWAAYLGSPAVPRPSTAALRGTTRRRRGTGA